MGCQGPTKAEGGPVTSGPSRRLLLVAVLGGLLCVNITFTLFNVVLVDMARDLHSTQTTLTWAITGPLLILGVAAPIVGKFGDLHGHRQLYLVGMLGALVCAALTAVAWNASSLIVARLFSGFEAACLTASSWALLFRVFRPHERTQVLGWWSLVGAGGPVIGVAIGGPIVQAVGWRWVFVGQVPLIAIALLVNMRVLSETPRTEGARLDLAGAATLATGIGAVLFGLNRGGVDGWSSPAVLIPLAAAPVALAAFVFVERRVPSPLFPLEWLSRRNFTMPCLAGFGLNFAYMGGFFLTPLFMERALGYNVGTTGLMQIARPLVFALSAPAAGYLTARHGERRTSVAGCAVLVLSMLCFAVVHPGTPGMVILAALALSGLASGVATPPISSSVANAVEEQRMGAGSAGLQVANQVGVVAGIQLMETIQTGAQRGAGLAGSFSDAYLVGTVVAVLAMVAASFIRSAPAGGTAPVLATEARPRAITESV